MTEQHPATLPERAPMTKLSPVAQVVIDAWWNADDGEYIAGVWTPNRSAQLAATLETVADQVVPEEPMHLFDQRWMYERDARQSIRSKLLTIVAELRGNTTTQEDK